LAEIRFSAADLAMIHGRAKGLPAAINAEAAARLNRRFSSWWQRTRDQLTGKRLSTQALAISAVALLTGLGVWQAPLLQTWWQQLPWSESASLSGSPTETGHRKSLAIDVPPLSALEEKAPPVVTPIASSTPPQPATQAAAEPVAPIAANLAPALESEPILALAAMIEPEAVSTPALSTARFPRTPDAAQSPDVHLAAPHSVPEDARNAIAVPEDIHRAEPNTSLPETLTTAPRMTMQVTATPTARIDTPRSARPDAAQAVTRLEQIPTPQSKPRSDLADSPGKSPEPASAAATVLRDDWFRQRDPEELVIQLMASAQEQALRDVTARYQLPGKVGYFRFKRRGRDWYALALGPFSSEQQARAALAELPSALKVNQPYIRTMASVHADMNR
jgi:DamX protein